jgi:hypothetical protein
MEKVTIDRKKWLRGDAKYSCLWSKEVNAGCCLGHVCIQLFGKTIDQIDLKNMPICVLNRATVLTVGPHIINSSFAIEAAQINDDPDISDEERENRLIKLFQQNNIQLSFY